MFCHNNKAFLFASKKDAAGGGAALKKSAPAAALGSCQRKNRLRLHPKSGGSRRLRLRKKDKQDEIIRRRDELMTFAWFVKGQCFLKIDFYGKRNNSNWIHSWRRVGWGG